MQTQNWKSWSPFDPNLVTLFHELEIGHWPPVLNEVCEALAVQGEVCALLHNQESLCRKVKDC